MTSIRFGVNDSQVRDVFIRRLLHDAIDGLADSSQSKISRQLERITASLRRSSFRFRDRSAYR